MEEVNSNELVGQLDQLSAEADHNINIIEGVSDTVSGTESMDLTEAQHYLVGVMYANGVAPLNRAGNEGILSKIKTFIQVAIVMVKEFFHKVWKFFFGDQHTRNQKRVKKLLEQQISELGGIDKHRELSDDMKDQMRLNLEALAKKEAENHEKLEAVFQDAHNSGAQDAQMWVEFSRHDDKLQKAMNSELVKKSYDTVGEAIEFLRNGLHVNSNLGEMLSEGQKLIRIGEQAIKIGESALKGEDDKDRLLQGEAAMKLAKSSMRAVKITMDAMSAQISMLERMATHLRPQHFK